MKDIPNRTHVIAFCADNRLVYEQRLEGKVSGLRGRLTDDDGDFIYACYVSSPFLDENVRPERTGFDLLKNGDGLFAETEVTQEDIESAVIEKARENLSKYLTENLQRAKDRVEKFVSTKAPRYRPILPRIPDGQLDIDPEISDKDLDLALHKQLAESERQLIQEGHDIMRPGAQEDAEDYARRLSGYLTKAEDIKKSDLAAYVAHRKTILDVLEKSLERKEDGNYVREDVIHGLIMPMRKDSTEVLSDACNLWIVDDRLAFHDYLASDKTLSSMPITDSKETKEPDICVLNLYDNPTLVSEGNSVLMPAITIVEIKRPMRNDAAPGEAKDPVDQALGYLARIRDGKVQTASGRQIPESRDIPAFCYILCDMTPKMVERCRRQGMVATPDGLGFFDYNPNYRAYIEVIGFDRLVRLAKDPDFRFDDCPLTIAALSAPL